MNSTYSWATKAKKRVFISFDYDHDSDLKTLLVGQSKLEDSPFEIADWSVKEELTALNYKTPRHSFLLSNQNQLT